uniref:Secreted protein n=1 Tax=Rhizophora mucronata TaxID=61149 RepID=A0A2P2MVR9_RHIMU
MCSLLSVSLLLTHACVCSWENINQTQQHSVYCHVFSYIIFFLTFSTSSKNIRNSDFIKKENVIQNLGVPLCDTC